MDGISLSKNVLNVCLFLGKHWFIISTDPFLTQILSGILERNVLLLTQILSGILERNVPIYTELWWVGEVVWVFSGSVRDPSDENLFLCFTLHALF